MAISKIRYTEQATHQSTIVVELAYHKAEQRWLAEEAKVIKATLSKRTKLELVIEQQEAIEAVIQLTKAPLDREFGQQYAESDARKAREAGSHGTSPFLANLANLALRRGQERDSRPEKRRTP